jgi:hypothetical protein
LDAQNGLTFTHTEKIITRYVFTVRYNLQSDGTPHVLEGSLFLIISWEGFGSRSG